MENDAVREKKQKAEKVPLLFDDHESSEEIAKVLIPKYHPYISGAKIKYLCRNKSTTSGGNKVPGTVKKASPLERHVCDEVDFIMIIALDVWNTLSYEQRTALVDHLLSRCVGVEDETNGEMKYSVQPPPVQEFPEVAQRHGKWNQGLAELGASLLNK